ncbi:hypothetical protein T459_18671 [Capsicum annuum]|uniref:Uncharacterized protein n=1 Tax=Capsicum annuum TaxID=4072 RepID=A0A2G2YZJ1_CAPAN|nr:hypothetical protein T459_18671 [Capsicum annuum]
MAYASIASLVRTMELLLMSDLPMLSLAFCHREEIVALHKKVSSIEAFLKNSEKQISSYGAMTDLEVRIKGFANAAEEKIEFGLREAMIAEDETQRGKAHEELRESLRQVAKDIDRVQEESKTIQDHKGRQVSTRSLARDMSSEKLPNLEASNNMVGSGKQKKRVLEEIRGGSSDEQKIFPIVGMGGIGKTALAKQVFNHPSIQSHFDIRAWATISKEYNVKEILLSLLQSIIKINDKVYCRSEAELADLLQKYLKRKRYLIVKDDIWNYKAWDETRQCFPIINNGSRILLTTRHTEVALYASSSNLLLKMNLMNSDESWYLFKSKAYANERFPFELKATGKEISKRCHGLPLTIVVVAGLLSKSKSTKEEWKNVAENIKSFLMKDPAEQCLCVVALSYNYLPNDLKACLLYLGIFPEDSEISVKKLVRLWIAEGFLKLEGDLEEAAENRLQDLVDTCLTLASQKSADGRKIKTCRVHVLVNELCLREAQRENFLFIRNDKTETVPLVGCRLISKQKRRQTGVCFHDENFVTSLTHTNDDDSPLRRIHSIFLFAAPSLSTNSNLELGYLNLIRVFDLSSMYFSDFPLQTLSLSLLSYLSFSTHISFGIPRGIRKLLNLQTCIVQGSVHSFIKFPELTWEIKQLRHLKLRIFYLSDPLSSSTTVIRHCLHLEEIPIEFADIYSLQLIESQNCSAKLAASAERIQEEQESLGSKAIDVRSYNDQESICKRVVLGNTLSKPLLWSDLSEVTLWLSSGTGRANPEPARVI